MLRNKKFWQNLAAAAALALFPYASLAQEETDQEEETTSDCNSSRRSSPPLRTRAAFTSERVLTWLWASSMKRDFTDEESVTLTFENANITYYDGSAQTTMTTFSVPLAPDRRSP